MWIFVIISGYLAGNTFFQGSKYKPNRQGVGKYIINRLSYIALPTFIFIFTATVLCYPKNLKNVKLICRYMTFTFTGDGGGNGIGATWYVFTIIWLYAVTGILCKLYIIYENNVDKIEKNNKAIIAAITVVLVGAAYRLGLALLKVDWYKYRYVSPIANLDLYCVGIIANRVDTEVKKEKLNKWLWTIIAFFMLFIILNCFVYYYGEMEEYYKLHLISIYQNIFPSVYAFFVFLIVGLTKDNRIKEPEWLAFLSRYEFNFYLWHSLVLLKMTDVIQSDWPIIAHFSLLLVSFVVTGVISIVFTEGEKCISRSVEAATLRLFKLK